MTKWSLSAALILVQCMLCARVTYAGGHPLSTLMKAIAARDQTTALTLLNQIHSQEVIDLSEKDEKGWTPLSLASALGEARVIEALLEHNADLSLGIEIYGMKLTPFALAAIHGKAEALIQIMRSAVWSERFFKKEVQMALSLNSLQVDQALLKAIPQEAPGTPPSSDGLEPLTQDGRAQILSLVFGNCNICLEAPGTSNPKKDGLRGVHQRNGDSLITPCFHCFCESCLHEWLNQGSNQCPSCMQELEPNTLETARTLQSQAPTGIRTQTTLAADLNPSFEWQADQLRPSTLFESIQDHTSQGIIAASYSIRTIPEHRLVAMMLLILTADSINTFYPDGLELMNYYNLNIFKAGPETFQLLEKICEYNILIVATVGILQMVGDIFGPIVESYLEQANEDRLLSRRSVVQFKCRLPVDEYLKDSDL